MQGVQIPSLVWEVRSRAAKMQSVKQNNIVTNSIKTLKMVHIKKKKVLKKVFFPPRLQIKKGKCYALERENIFK